MKHYLPQLADFHPYRVMGQGTMDNLKWWVLDANGNKLVQYDTAGDAILRAQALHDGSVA